jgi:hypothetical protein
MTVSIQLRAAGAGVLALALLGCPGGKATVKKAPEPCKAFAQACEFEPGKLGSCSYRANCSGPNCLYCQSQH